jgi:hypothetical protein
VIELERYDESQTSAWDDFVRASTNGTFLFLRGYMDYHRDRFEDGSLVARRERGGPLLALLPANVAGGVLESHGGLSYGGWVWGVGMTATLMLELFAKLREYLAAQALPLLRYRPVPHVYHRAPAEEDLYALARAGARLVARAPLSVVDRRRPLAWQSRRRRGVRRARAAGLVCHETADLAGYWELLSRMLRDTYGARPAHSLDEMVALQRRLPAHIRLFGCYAGEQMLAGVLVYVHDTVARAQYIAASAEGKRAAALDLLFEHLLAEAFADKAWFDLGTSEGAAGGLNEGVVEFKESLGAHLVAQDTYELAVQAAAPPLRPPPGRADETAATAGPG